MLLSSLPSRQNDISDSGPHDVAPLHERLFGVHSTWFYVRVGIAMTLMTALLVVTVMYAPHRIPHALGALVLPVFVLIVGSPSRKVQAVAMGIMGGLIWSYLQVGPATVAAAALVTGIASYTCDRLMTREMAALTGQTRRQRISALARLTTAVVVNWALVAVPGTLIV